MLTFFEVNMTIKRKPTIGLLLFAILILAVQNFLLVRKNDQYLDFIHDQREELTALKLLSKGELARPIDAVDLNGSAVFINPQDHWRTLFFAFSTTCTFCKKNMPNWNALSRDLRKAGVYVVGISPDLEVHHGQPKGQGCLVGSSSCFFDGV